MSKELMPIYFIISKSRSAYKTGGQSRPFRWEDFLIEYARSREIIIIENTAKSLFKPGNYFTLEYGPTIRMLFQRIIGVRFIYVHWGIATSENRFTELLRKLRYFLIFKFASLVLVNDDVSLSEVKGLSPKVRVQKFRYPVDIDYYSSCAAIEVIKNNSVYFYSPGNAYRDEELILGLSKNGFNFVRTMQNDDLFRKYVNNKSSNYNIVNNADTLDVVELYKHAEAIVLPLTEGGSASGQHVILESILMKKIIFITRNRISAEFENYTNVILVNSSNLSDWVKILKDFTSASSIIKRQSSYSEVDILKHNTDELFRAMDCVIQINVEK
jgi:hypothetical protein